MRKWGAVGWLFSLLIWFASFSYCVMLALQSRSRSAFITHYALCITFHLLGGTGVVPGTGVFLRISAMIDRGSALRMRAEGLTINRWARVVSARAFTSSGMT